MVVNARRCCVYIILPKVSEDKHIGYYANKTKAETDRQTGVLGVDLGFGQRLDQLNNVSGEPPLGSGAQTASMEAGSLDVDNR